MTAAIALIAMGATGCSEDDQPSNSLPPVASPSPLGEPSAPIPSEPVVEASAPATDAGLTATSAASPDPVLKAGDFVDVTPTGEASKNFQTPTGNIQCVFAAGEAEVPYVSCVVLEADWSAPEDPTCELDWVDTELGMSDDVYVGSCRGDTFLVQDPPTLHYGQGRTSGPLACMSRRDGVMCSNSDTRHGFRAARRSYDVF